MSRLTLKLRNPLSQRIDVSAISPDRLAGIPVDSISRLPMYVGKQKVELGELFSVNGSDSENIVFAGGANLDRVGQGMSHGSVRVDGDAGAYAGAEMRGGEVVVSGSVAMLSACGMRGGELRVGGNAGDFLGGALVGEMRGMRGGMVTVAGNAGDRIGDRMRRGVILIAGDAGQYCASRMIAGTIAVSGDTGAGAGYGMTRGTLLCSRAPERMLATFNECGTFELGFLKLMTRQWTKLGAPFDQYAARPPRVQRWMGDLGSGGKGEILVWR
ncbi:MAG: formylmethanofuran dehydrogenase subunit C [Sterolibacteriaceae bacterium]|nr:formylmethanofuran dehydrogenase subunit C [Sterolibacteriaceae bacterium]MBK9084327.1 formylmethanofuran dehydrogenase subunit C [Sterolibacteriaceae bacterium]